MTWLGVVVTVVIICLLVWWFDPASLQFRAYEAELATREPLPDAEMIARYFAGTNLPVEVPATVRRIFAKHTGYPAEKLLPDDDLEFFWEEMDQAELLDELESEFGIKFSQSECERTSNTIRSVSLLIAGILAKERVIDLLCNSMSGKS